MSKTNHRRGDKDHKFKNGQRGFGYYTFNGGRETMDGKRINAYATITAGNNESVRRACAGAKKFISSRTRFHDRMACDKIVREGLDD